MGSGINRKKGQKKKKKGRQDSMSKAWGHEALLYLRWWNTRYALEVPRDEALNSGWERPGVKNTKGLTVFMPRSVHSNTQAVER